ncbi:MAG: L,D-transpeptidase family protein [Gemmatimonadaceae bacterium]
MHSLIRCAVGLTLGVGALAFTGCTVSDVSEQQVPAAGGSTAASEPASPTTQDTSVTPITPSVAVAPGSAVGTAPGAAQPGDTAVSTGNLSPDSVDVGRHVAADSASKSRLRLEVDVAARKLYVYDGEARVATQSVAVGSPEWPTQTGAWTVRQVVWNPAWIPPDESWAEQRTAKKPGAPDNPLGRAQLVYDPPRTIHGTNDPASIGKAVSHGSIRLSNAAVTSLARQLMEATGVGKDDAWYQRVRQNRTEKVIVDLPQRVPIRVF